MMDVSVKPHSAAEWFLAIHAVEEPSPEILQGWLRWLEESEQNRQAFEDVARVWHATPSAMIAQRPSERREVEYDGTMSIAQWHSNARNSVTKRRWARGIFGPRMFAAAAAIAALATGLWAYQAIDSQPLSNRQFVTSVGEDLPLTLPDGSRVVLGAQSRLSINFDPHARKLRLESGEAFFSVRKDPTRPFTVSALNGTITAIGTAFNVRNMKDRVSVTVTEGAVRIADATISRGEQLSYQSNAERSAIEIEAPRRVDVAESTGWRDGWLIYRDEPLDYVIADISRYVDIDVSLSSSAEQLQFSGAVSKDRIGEWLAALPEVAPVEVDQRGRHVTIRLK